ncbi:uncharacterized protein E0L32_009019 [Thyridium curvatum]|uniref:Uncharacterized protein n=1 Tax=Thyridium curvatum TaxID=1093900 RepID=A0A507AYD4_9PEZI|nr:uncharacterized protein E0L32_009019 [Thyridium curvatum]TPX09828.1 hypothetical protein E0L32_009019 [Thyridium curvatum]
MSTSPLTALPSSSSPASFYTPVGGSPATAGDCTNLSTPATEPASSPYRDARPLPRELKEHCQIFFEEQMYNAGIQLLDSLLCAGAGARPGHGKPACVPPPPQIALLATLAIHPTHTTRVAERAQLLVASEALQYLRNLLAIAGPVNANLRAAFEFRVSSRGGRRHYGLDATSDEDDVDEEHIHGRFANESSLWTRGQDLWKVLGWAFNCSAVHPHRWRYWRPWLEFLMDALEADFDERQRLDLEAHERSARDGEDCKFPLLRESLLMSHINTGNRLGLKTIMKSLCAEGSQASLTVFQEVFEKESKSAAQASNKRKREQILDLDNDKFGDYYDDGASMYSSQESEPPTPEKMARGPGRPSAQATRSPPPSAGFIESIPLRLHCATDLFPSFLQLARASLELPKPFAALHEVYGAFADAVRELRAPLFAPFVSTRASPLPVASQVSLLRALLEPFLPRASPYPGDVDAEADEENGVSLAILRECYLPFAANNNAVEANAKYSLVAENLVRLVWAESEVRHAPELQRAVEKGVRARGEKARARGRGRPPRGPAASEGGGGDEGVAREALDRSGERLLTMMRVLEIDSAGASD